MSSVFQIPVKMGSRKLIIEIESTSKITCGQFVEMVLKKCKLNSHDKLTKTYSLFESVSGIEQLLKSNDNFVNIWKNWLNEYKQHNVEFIVRKCLSIENKLNTSIKTKSDEKHKQMIKNYYKKINSESKQQQQKQSDETTKQEYITKTIQNEQELKKQSEQLLKIQSLIENLEKAQTFEEVQSIKAQSKKLCSFHQASVANNLHEKISVNINFLQFLYYKLKKQNSHNNSYKKLIDTSCLNNSFGEDNYDSSRSSRTSSTSTLESLV
jgi:hypothetical protein